MSLSYRFTTNSQGYSDWEWDSKEEKGLRVLALGDSFTEGFGAEQNQSWVAQISKLDTVKKIKWYNGGVSGSDPFINFFALNNELKQLNLDIVVQIYSSQDFDEDVLLRGGSSRFKDSGLLYKSIPKSEIFYAYSHIIRMIHRLRSGKVFFIPISELERNSTQTSFDELVKDYRNWAEKNQIHIILIFFHTDPYYYSLGRNMPEIDLQSKKINNWLTIKSISDCYREEYSERKDTFRQLWWKNDGHHNAQGYEMMAKCIEEVIELVIDSVYQRKMNQEL